MATVTYAAPVLPGMLDDWKAFHQALDGPKRREFEEQQRRLGLVRHRVWLQETDAGPLAIAVQEGEEPERAREILAASAHPFDVWFREQEQALHGVDPASAPDAPATTLYVDYMLSATRRGPDYDLPDFNA